MTSRRSQDNLGQTPAKRRACPICRPPKIESRTQPYKHAISPQRTTLLGVTEVGGAPLRECGLAFVSESSAGRATKGGCSIEANLGFGHASRQNDTQCTNVCLMIGPILRRVFARHSMRPLPAGKPATQQSCRPEEPGMCNYVVVVVSGAGGQGPFKGNNPIYESVHQLNLLVGTALRGCVFGPSGPGISRTQHTSQVAGCCNPPLGWLKQPAQHDVIFVLCSFAVEWQGLRIRCFGDIALPCTGRFPCWPSPSIWPRCPTAAQQTVRGFSWLGRVRSALVVLIIGVVDIATASAMTPVAEDILGHNGSHCGFPLNSRPTCGVCIDATSARWVFHVMRTNVC